MRTRSSGGRVGAGRWAPALVALACFGPMLARAVGQGLCGTGSTTSSSLARGRDLFLREWRPNDSRSHGGDGLGPLFNERSCVGCHHQGGAGGAGPNEKNVDMISLATAKGPKGLASAASVHPGFRDREGFMLPKFGLAPGYASYRRAVLSFQAKPGSTLAKRASRAPETVVTIRKSQRSTPALFGAGRIDAIPESDIEALAGRKHAYPEISGRVPRDDRGRVGRFGWKGQTASLEGFVSDACANELGLELPDRRQSPLPVARPARAPGPDLSSWERDDLVRFVASLEPPPDSRSNDYDLKRGEVLFAAVGCAACHVPDVGPAKGVYSDFLLHRMGGETADSAGGYGARAPESRPGSPSDPNLRPAAPDEWRTPPLWGVADSAPYLHDGRAPTLDAAILRHRGEAGPTADRYGKLAPRDRDRLLTFLNSRVAPAPSGPARPPLVASRRP